MLAVHLFASIPACIALTYVTAFTYTRQPQLILKSPLLTIVHKLRKHHHHKSNTCLASGQPTILMLQSGKHGSQSLSVCAADALNVSGS